ncbi:unnamed protein product [Candida verbasci]|uniref:Uncharacterized protein n=1 Tax=Candida verbasci TaxID=1227364 RepID=A0A9W4TPK3_9ASCO|nr:unnamed protein product [Candida verbasci]
MSKKKKGKNQQQQIPNKDNFSRLNYLYQASNSLSNNYPILSRGLNRNLKLISKRTTLKIHSNVKRTICKNCHSLLIPGISVSNYIENKSKSKAQHNDILVRTCLNCKAIKRFPTKIREGKNDTEDE